MEEKEISNPQSSKSNHNRQTFWQIYFPLLAALIGAAAILLLIFGKTAGGGIDVRVWADIAIILLILPLFLMLLVLLALSLAGSALTYKGSETLRSKLPKIRQISMRLTHRVTTASNGIRKTWDEVEAFTTELSRKYFK